MNTATTHHQLFSRLEGLYYALTLAVQDPVIIPNPEFDREKPNALPFDISKVYFYVDDERGSEIMELRLKTAASDITTAFRSHQQMSEIFSLLEQQARGQEKKEFAESITSLCTMVDAYASFIADHQQHLREKAFLDYPHYTDQHFSYRRQKKSKTVRGSSEGNLVQIAVVEKVVSSSLDSVSYFNSEGSQRGIEREMQQFRVVLSDLSSFQGSLWSEIYTGHPDSSYSKRIELTKMLLREHFSFDVEQEKNDNREGSR